MGELTLVLPIVASILSKGRKYELSLPDKKPRTTNVQVWEQGYLPTLIYVMQNRPPYLVHMHAFMHALDIS